VHYENIFRRRKRNFKTSARKFAYNLKFHQFNSIFIDISSVFRIKYFLIKIFFSVSIFVIFLLFPVLFYENFRRGGSVPAYPAPLPVAM
jgi:hypothetical protein